ncbi:hypothetical protein D9758_014724 [Tetrapyrgos nigripes]|uniref:Peptidase C14 caspase domain-containing protein n=1 Tax=Tetrapyrgos nigripes TaxID=182062 RepID=A0A8H5FI87_9AGAR|nr:hypothetical protein D9758_014724 [Tetrapyrgos nigripes]
MATSALSIYDRGNFHNRMPTTKRALLIGICYSTESSKLKGSHNDVKAFKELLLETYRYPEENITVMTDELSTPEHLWPTRENILRELRGFISQSQGNVQYCFLYAGHSIQSRCTDGTEEDGRNESLLPCDAMDILELDDQASLLAEEDVEGKVVMDDDLKRLLSDRLPSGCKLTAIMDTCHSATLLDQPHHRCNRIFRMSSSGRHDWDRTSDFKVQVD